MCSVLEFSSESDKLRTLFSESNHFDSVLFIFDGGRRYKVSSSSLGIHSPQDLLCLLYTSPSPRDPKTSRMPSSA